MAISHTSISLTEGKKYSMKSIYMHENNNGKFENDQFYSSNPIENEKTYKIYTIQHNKGNININTTSHIPRFSGESDESIENWLRQFNYLFIIGEYSITDGKIHHFASSFLIGKAGKFYDELKPQPKNWLEFINALKIRYQTKQTDKSSIFLQILTKKQQNNEKTKKFIRDVAKLANEARMNEEMALQATIKTLLANQTLYRLHIKNSFTFKALNELPDIIELEENYKIKKFIPTWRFENEEEQKHETSDLMNRIDKLTLSIAKSNRERENKVTLSCHICKKSGHTKYNRSYNSSYNKNTYRNRYNNHDDGQTPVLTNTRKDYYPNNQSYTQEKYNNGQQRYKNTFSSRKIETIEQLIGTSIPGTIKDVEKYITNPSQELKNLLNKLKTISNNSRKSRDDIPFDILTANLNINNLLVEAIIDTGASHSVISRELANKLNLPIYITERTNLSLADNNTISS
ncbi:hypothetical protein COBT_002232, partial [Conglomerata obtusa]